VAAQGPEEKKHKEAGFIMNSLSEIDQKMHGVLQKDALIRNPLVQGLDRSIKLPPLIIDPVPKFKQTYMNLLKDSHDPFNRKKSDLVDVGAISGQLVQQSTRMPSRMKTISRKDASSIALHSMAESAATQALMEHMMPGISRGGPGFSRVGSRSPRSRKLTRGILPSRGSLPVTARNEYRREPNADV